MLTSQDFTLVSVTVLSNCATIQKLTLKTPWELVIPSSAHVITLANSFKELTWPQCEFFCMQLCSWICVCMPVHTSREDGSVFNHIRSTC